MNKLKLRLMSIFSILTFVVSGSAILVVSSPNTVYAAKDCSSRFFGIPAWYDGLTDDDCDIIKPKNDAKNEDAISNFVWKIVLNIIEAALILVGYASVIFILIGGFRYLTSSGSPDRIKGAKMTLQNAIIGLVIALASVAIVQTIAGAI